MKTIQGTIKGRGKKIAIVVSRFNEYITKRLLDGCLGELKKNKVKPSDIIVAWVPGSMELPVVALKFAKKKTIDAVICLGAVIKGETFHYEMVSYGSMNGIAQASLLSGKPVIYGVLTCETIELANKRSEENGDNKGSDAAQAALEMIDVMKQ